MYTGNSHNSLIIREKPYEGEESDPMQPILMKFEFEIKFWIYLYYFLYDSLYIVVSMHTLNLSCMDGGQWSLQNVPAAAAP